MIPTWRGARNRRAPPACPPGGTRTAPPGFHQKMHYYLQTGKLVFLSKPCWRTSGCKLHETAQAAATNNLWRKKMRSRNPKQVEGPGVWARNGRQGGRRADHTDASTCQQLSYMRTSTLHLKYPKYSTSMPTRGNPHSTTRIPPKNALLPAPNRENCS